MTDLTHNEDTVISHSIILNADIATDNSCHFCSDVEATDYYFPAVDTGTGNYVTSTADTEKGDLFYCYNHYSNKSLTLLLLTTLQQVNNLLILSTLEQMIDHASTADTVTGNYITSAADTVTDNYFTSTADTMTSDLSHFNLIHCSMWLTFSPTAHNDD